jgi:hypothetical protein
VVEGDHAVHFRTGEVEAVGNSPNRGLWDVSEGVLNGVQDHNERPRFLSMAGNGGFNSLQFRSVSAGHDATP